MQVPERLSDLAEHGSPRRLPAGCGPVRAATWHELATERAR
jgi:hypothetical protein